MLALSDFIVSYFCGENSRGGGGPDFTSSQLSFLTKYLRNRHGFKDIRDKPKWALESFPVLIIELEGRAENQKHGLSPQLSWGFLQFSPKSIFLSFISFLPFPSFFGVL